MTFLSSACLYCNPQRSVTAEKSQWSIHLAHHREEIIKHLADTSSSCILCAYPVEFANKEHASSHYRWGHKKSTLIDWALYNMPRRIFA
ncbi:MAG: hypothetical protein HKM23_05705 [Nitrosopumilus sp.]|nr:hypothetical protein [Nitrosopumilus sp.]